MTDFADAVFTGVLVGLGLLVGVGLGASWSHSSDKELVVKQFCAPLCQPGDQPDVRFLSAVGRIDCTCTSVRTPK